MYCQEIDLGIVDYKQKSTADQTLVELWVLGDKFFIPSLQNAAIREIDRLRRRYRTTSTQCLEYIWDKTIQGSPLRKLFLEYCAFNIRSTRFLEKPDHFPKEMLLELAQLMIETGQPYKSKKVNRNRRDYYIY